LYLVWLENPNKDKHVEGAGFPCSGPGFESLHLHEMPFVAIQAAFLIVGTIAGTKFTTSSGFVKMELSLRVGRIRIDSSSEP